MNAIFALYNYLRILFYILIILILIFITALKCFFSFDDSPDIDLFYLEYTFSVSNISHSIYLC
jgi:hypothetical protein